VVVSLPGTVRKLIRQDCTCRDKLQANHDKYGELNEIQGAGSFWLCVSTRNILGI